MKKFLVVGNPIDHSLSPALHNYWIKSNAIDAIYEKQKLNEDEYYDSNVLVTKQSDALIKVLKDEGYDGLVYENQFDSQDSGFPFQGRMLLW